MYRLSNSTWGRPPSPPAPRNNWEQVERILDILDRNPVVPPGARPSIPGDAAPAPAFSPIDAWLRRPLRESHYLRAYGIGPDDELWNRMDGSQTAMGGMTPDASPWPPASAAPHPLPSPRPGPTGTQTMESDRLRGDRPFELPLLSAGDAPDASGTPGFDGRGGPPPLAPVPAPEPGDDPPPRIVAVIPRRSDRDIAEEILATMQRNDAARVDAGQLNPDQAPIGAAGNAPASESSVQVAQALHPWTPFPTLNGSTEAREGGGFLPAAQRGKVPFIPSQESLADHVQLPRGGGRGSKGTSLAPKPGTEGGPSAGKGFSERTKGMERQGSGFKCVFCGKDTVETPKPSPNRAHTDHAIPRSRGGNAESENAQNTCQACNLQKGTKTTEEYLGWLKRHGQ